LAKQREHGKNLGARGFIHKPFTDQELRAALLDVADTSA
jgi:CheY-like chemotaxis protein